MYIIYNRDIRYHNKRTKNSKTHAYEKGHGDFKGGSVT